MKTILCYRWLCRFPFWKQNRINTQESIWLRISLPGFLRERVREKEIEAIS